MGIYICFMALLLRNMLQKRVVRRKGIEPLTIGFRDHRSTVELTARVKYLFVCSYCLNFFRSSHEGRGPSNENAN